MEQVEPRIWLGIAVASLLASVVPYWLWIGQGGVLVSAVLAFIAAVTLVANVRGEHRRTRDLYRREEDQRRAMDGAPSSTNDAGTSTEPSSRW